MNNEQGKQLNLDDYRAAKKEVTIQSSFFGELMTEIKQMRIACESINMIFQSRDASKEATPRQARPIPVNGGNDVFVSVVQASHMTGRNIKTIRGWIQRGILKSKVHGDLGVQLVCARAVIDLDRDSRRVKRGGSK